MKQITLKFGLMAGTIVVVYSMAVALIMGDIADMSVAEFKMLEVLGFLRYLILLLTVFYAMRTFKKNTMQPVRYWAVVKQGVMVAVVIGVCIGLMEAVYMAMNPGFFDSFGKLYVARLKSGGATAAEIAEAIKEMENYKWLQHPLAMGLFYFFETAILGSVAALIIGWFLRTKKALV